MSGMIQKFLGAKQTVKEESTPAPLTLSTSSRVTSTKRSSDTPAINSSEVDDAKRPATKAQRIIQNNAKDNNVIATEIMVDKKRLGNQIESYIKARLRHNDYIDEYSIRSIPDITGEEQYTLACVNALSVNYNYYKDCFNYQEEKLFETEKKKEDWYSPFPENKLDVLCKKAYFSYILNTMNKWHEKKGNMDIIINSINEYNTAKINEYKKYKDAAEKIKCLQLLIASNSIYEVGEKVSESVNEDL
jgi:hypothetical protein